MEAIMVGYSAANAGNVLKDGLVQRLQKVHKEIVVLCIGTDRSTGDSLGPMVGSLLQKAQAFPVAIYGNLDEPVHAMNLATTIETIHSAHKSPFIIAIDACLGKLNNVGMVSIKEGPLRPGAGVKKELPEVGDIQITGNVNVGGFMEFMVLQNTRLSLVMKMAEVIAASLTEALHEVTLIQLQSYRRALLVDAYEARYRNTPLFGGR